MSQLLPSEEDRPVLTPDVEGLAGLKSALLQAEPKAPETGDLLGRYRVGASIGHGGSGLVFRAYDTEMRRTVAIKVIRPERTGSRERARLQREALAAARMTHSGIITVHEVAESQGMHFIVMEYVHGETLAERIKRGSIPTDVFIATIRKIALALHYAHEQGVIHRDIKPGNILLREDGSPVITDFGLAMLRESHDRVTQTGYVAGTPLYMSPEQVHGGIELDGRTDLYSLGVILFEGLTGRVPFRGRSPAHIYRQILRRDAPALRDIVPSLPPALEWIVFKCLEKSRAKRYTSLKEFSEDLGRWQKGERPIARPPSRSAILFRALRRNRLKISVAASFLSLLGASHFYFEGRERSLDSDRKIQQEQALSSLFQRCTRSLAGGEDPRALIGDLERAAEAAPHDPRPHAWLARILRNLEEEAKAEQYALQCLEIDPTHAQAHSELARILMSRYFGRRGFPEMYWMEGEVRLGATPSESEGCANLRTEAEEHLAAARTAGLSPSELDCLEGMRALVTYDLPEAIERFGRYLQDAPWDVSVLDYEAQARKLSGDLSGSAALLRRAVALVPQRAPLHFRLAEILLYQGAYSDALSSVRTAVMLSPRTSEYRDLRARIHLAAAQHSSGRERTDHLKRAHAEVRTALRHNPRCMRTWHTKGLLLLQEGRNSEASDAFSRILESDPDDLSARTNRAIARFRQGVISDALDDLNRALAIDQGNAVVLACRGTVLAMSGDLNRAHDDLSASLSAQSRQPMTLCTLGRVQGELHQLDAAEQSLSKALDMDPDLALARFYRANIYLAREQLTAALGDIDHALVLEPDNSEYLRVRGNCRLLAAQEQDHKTQKRTLLLGAIKDIEEFLRRDPASSVASLERQNLEIAKTLLASAPR